MSGVSKTIFHTLRLFLLLTLIIFAGTPNVSLSEEGGATTTPELLLTATTTATTTPVATASTTSPVIPTDETIPPKPQEETATSTGEILGVSAFSDEENEELPEEQSLESAFLVPDVPPLTKREFRKRVRVDTGAFHSCEAETFRIDITGKSNASARIALQRDSDLPYEVEVGGLPQGIDVTFSGESVYKRSQRAGEHSIVFDIVSQVGSQKGNFMVPIMYTKKDGSDSSVICQINIINR